MKILLVVANFAIYSRSSALLRDFRFAGMGFPYLVRYFAKVLIGDDIATPYPLIYHPYLSLIRHSARVLNLPYNLHSKISHS
jgi:hypothetical protein